MFSKDTYISRRQELKKLVKSGVIILFGNNNSPCNFPNNGYYPFRQDSTFLYYFGLQRDGLVGVIDIDNDIETLIGDDIDLVDIVWYGSVDSVHNLAEQVGVHNSAPMKSLKTICNDAMAKKRKIHFLPPYRYDIKLQVFDLLGIHPNQQKEEAAKKKILPKNRNAFEKEVTLLPDTTITVAHNKKTKRIVVSARTIYGVPAVRLRTIASPDTSRTPRNWIPR